MKSLAAMAPPLVILIAIVHAAIGSAVVNNKRAVNAEFANAELLATEHAVASLKKSSPAIRSTDLRNYVERLASREYQGRGTGLKGERMATAYLARFFDDLGLNPEGDDSGYFQDFPVPIGFELAGTNALEVTLTLNEAPKVDLGLKLDIGKDIQPMAFSPNTKFEGQSIVFAGFGARSDKYDSFEGLDVKDKWLLVFRGVPASNARELGRQGPLVAKARLAKELGAAGIIYVKGKNASLPTELVNLNLPLGADGLLPSCSMTNEVAATLIEKASDEGFSEIYDAYNGGSRVAGFDLGATISGEINLQRAETIGRNVLGRFVVGDQPSRDVIVVGAHIDHIGFGNRGASRARGLEGAKMHVGADDNASGVAAMMEIAQRLVRMKEEGELTIKRDVIFGAWSGEEMGLYGSRHFVEELKKNFNGDLYPRVGAYLNMDMLGRWEDNGMTVHGVGSSSIWDDWVNEAAGEVDLRMKKSQSPFLPTDMVSFYTAGIPVVAAFTGLHGDYHKPSDTPDKIDYDGLGKISMFMLNMTLKAAGADDPPDYIEIQRGRRSNPGRAQNDEKKEKHENQTPSPGGGPPKVSLGVLLGGSTDDGILIGGVTPDSAASQAGLEEGDIISKLNGKDVRTRDELLDALRTLEPDKAVPLEYLRDGKRKSADIKPAAR